MASTSARKIKSAEKALEEFLKDYVNSGQLSADIAEVSASQRLQAVTKLLPYCFPKPKEEKATSSKTQHSGSESLALFFRRLTTESQ